MARSNRAAAALMTAVAGVSLLGFSVPALRADSVWVNPLDPAGNGTDPTPALNLPGMYESAAHWDPVGVPGSAANVLFDVPGYPGIPYTVSFAQNETAGAATIANPVSFDLGGNTYALTSTAQDINNVSLLITNQLTVQHGTLQANSIQVGSSTTPAPVFLTIDGSTGAALSAASNSTVFNFQTINVTNGASFNLGDNVLVNQAPDLGSGGINGGAISVDGAGSGVFFGDGVTVRGGSIHATNGGFISAQGNSLTYDSLFYDADLFLGNPTFTMNLKSSLTDPNNANAIIPTTITGVVNLGDGNLNIIGSVVQLTPDSGNTFTSFTIVGNSHLTITNSILTTGLFNLDGDGAPGTGSHTVIDPSVINVHSDMIVGELGNAEVDITGSGNSVRVDGGLVIGDQEGSTSSLTITGINSALRTGLNDANSFFGGGNIVVGNGGAGLMNIQGGAHVDVNGGYGVYVGTMNNSSASGGAGTLTISGGALNATNDTVQSTLDTYSAGTDIVVGFDNQSSGVLNITGGGFVYSRNATLGANAGSSGSALVDGSFYNAPQNVAAVSQWLNIGYIVVGDAGQGSLVVSNSGVVDAGDNFLIANQIGSTGAVLVSSFATLDADTNNDNTKSLTVGLAGSGSLTILSGGIVFSNNTAIIAANAGSAGHVLVENQFSQLNVAGELDVGFAGAGFLTMDQGASVVNTIGRIGASAGSTGTVLVDNATWNNLSFLEVADSGSATLTIQNGGNVNAVNLNMAFFAGSVSHMTVDNATLTNTGFLTVGNGGSATLAINHGGRVYNTDANVGFNAGATGVVTVGQNSLWDIIGFLQVGGAGSGTLTITNGGSVTNHFGGIGRDLGSFGLVVVDGPGSGWTSVGNLDIGSGGNGSLLVQNGGSVSNSDVAFLGASASSNGLATITGTGSLWSNASQLIVAVDGAASLLISSGGRVTATLGTSVTSSAAIIGEEGTGVGVLTITDPGSKLTLTGHLAVGFGNNGSNTTTGGTGTLNVLNGALITDTNGYIGRYAGSKGTATVSGNGASWQNSGRFFIAANDTAGNVSGQTLAAGAGTLTLGAGGSVSALTSATIGAAGVLNMQGGSFTAPSIALSGLIHGTGFLFGPVSGSGTVQSDTPGSLISDSLVVPSLIVNGVHTLRTTAVGASKVSSLVIANSTPGVFTGKLDLTTDKLIVQAAGAADKTAKLTTINAEVNSGANVNLWNGNGITSSTAAANAAHYGVGIFDNAILGLTSFGGQPTDTNSIFIALAHLGDANRNGIVDIQDLTIVANNWQQHRNNWALGDLNRDGIVDIQDFTIVANNWQQTSSFPLTADAPIGSAPASVPEPATLPLLAFGIFSLIRRKALQPPR